MAGKQIGFSWQACKREASWELQGFSELHGAQGTTLPAWLAQPVQINRQRDGWRCQTSAAAVARSARRSESGLQPCTHASCDAFVESALFFEKNASPPLTYQNNNCTVHKAKNFGAYLGFTSTPGSM